VQALRQVQVQQGVEHDVQRGRQHPAQVPAQDQPQRHELAQGGQARQHVQHAGLGVQAGRARAREAVHEAEQGHAQVRHRVRQRPGHLHHGLDLLDQDREQALRPQGLEEPEDAVPDRQEGAQEQIRHLHRHHHRLVDQRAQERVVVVHGREPHGGVLVVRHVQRAQHRKHGREQEPPAQQRGQRAEQGLGRAR